MYIFGYGSLINAESIGRTFKRKVSYKEMIPATIEGYSRSWTGAADVELVIGDKVKRLKGIFLDLTESQKCCNGILIKVTKDELENLIAREYSYDLISVSAKTDNDNIDAYTFRVPIDNKSSDGYILSDYIKIVNEGLLNYSKTFRESFWNQTLAHKVKEIAGKYNWPYG